MRTLLSSCSVLCLVAFATGQDLRRGLVDADVVVVGRHVHKQMHGDEVALHRVSVLADIRGAGGNGTLTVLDWPNLSRHVRPMPHQSRLYCLDDASAVATRLGLPTAGGPYYKMVGWAGSHPLVGKEIDQDPYVRFARVLAAGETGTPAADTATALAAIALEPSAELRLEATRYLTERGDLSGRLDSLVWSRLMTRASGEVDDIQYKIALAELCADQRFEGLLDALAVSLGQVTDPEYARCVGRIGRVLHGEEATAKLRRRLDLVGRAEDRRMLLLAIGATNTETALDALLRMDGRDAAVNAALKEHRSPRAREAVANRK
jgi:hypothetical protein